MKTLIGTWLLIATQSVIAAPWISVTEAANGAMEFQVDYASVESTAEGVTTFVVKTVNNTTKPLGIHGIAFYGSTQANWGVNCLKHKAYILSIAYFEDSKGEGLRVGSLSGPMQVPLEASESVASRLVNYVCGGV